MKSIIKPFIVLLLCFAAVGGYYFYSLQEQAPAPETAPPEPAPSKPAIVSEIAPKPLPETNPALEIAPTPKPELEIAAPERPNAMEWIANNWRGRILSISITEKQKVPVYADGQIVGEAALPMDQPIPVNKLSGDTVTVEFLGHLHEVPFAATDITERANAALDRALATSTSVPKNSSSETTINEAPEPTVALDVIAFGNAPSEQQHDFKGEHSKVIQGGLEQAARKILPLDTGNWKGGSLDFTLKVDPDNQNYMTVKFWGSDVTKNRLVIFIEGKQIGYVHLGDIDILDFGSEAPTYTDRFYYTTTPLPKNITRGKDSVELSILCQGGVWAYGMKAFDSFQHAMEKPSRGIYAAYSHTDSFFQPSSSEVQGTAPENPRKRSEPSREILDKLKERVNGRINAIRGKKEPYVQPELRFLANAYFIKWTDAYKDKEILEQLMLGGDLLYTKYKADTKAVTNDGATRNNGWFGLGPLGDAIWLLKDEINPRVWDEKLSDGKTRREAWTEMFVYTRDWNMGNRRQYTNQGMIKDLYGIHLTNKGLAAFNPSAAIPSEQTIGYLHEAVGIKPWLGPVDDNGRHTKPMGDDYYQLTQKGLTKELGYVGAYGEVLDWVADIYNGTRPEHDQPGDPEILKQLVKIERARSYFRYPMLDADGYRAMRMEGVVGWRDFKFPGVVVYGQKASRDASALQTADATRDVYSISYAQQMFDDNQFFASIETQMKSGGLHNTAGIMHIPDQYDTIRQLPKSPHQLPMTPGQPDFVFSDEEVGVIAIKNGTEIFYASLYWRARFGINNLARVHHMTPEFARIATVHQATEFNRSGMTYERPNWTNAGFSRGGPKYPDGRDSAHTGEKLPIARVPSDIDFKPGNENVFAGKGNFYTLQYGPYLIGMNCTTDKTYDLEIPESLMGEQVKNLTDGSSFKAFGKLAVKPRSTIVLYKE
ncbi:MAG: hypothetical protein ACSHYA_03990 [Opitutaceae bacterium]